MAATIQDTSSFAGRASSPPFSGLRPDSTLPAASLSWGASRRWATGTCANCSSWARMRCCFTASPTPIRWDVGEEADREETLQLVAVALANKMARIAFAILRSKTVYREIA